MGPSHCTDLSDDGLLFPFPFQFTNFCNKYFFPLQFLWIKKNKGEENREVPLRDTGDTAECILEIFKCQDDGCNWRTWIKQSLAHRKGGQKLQQKPYMLGLRGSLLSLFFLLVFLPGLWLCYSCLMLLGDKNKHSALTACNRSHSWQA